MIATFRVILFSATCGLSLTACHPNASETHKNADVFVFDEEQNLFRTAIFEALKQYETAEVRSGLKGYYGQKLTMAGREDILFKENTLRQSRYSCTTLSDQKHASLPQQITDVLSDYKILIINEHHSYPLHRSTINSLLIPLKEKGFTHYAAETFSLQIAKHDDKGATVGMGYYSNEPTFGQLMSKANALGFKLAAYEQTDEQAAPENSDRAKRIANREIAQSENLAAILDTLKPEEKILIHVGHSHVAERPIPYRNGKGETSWMAHRLKNLTGIDPLTISQTDCKSANKNAYLSSRRVSADAQKADLFTDFAIAFPEMEFKNSRPVWRYEASTLEIAIPEGLTDEEQTVLYEVRSIGSSDKTVPIDRLLVRPGETNIPLLLPAGNYRINAFVAGGNFGKAVSITVPKP